MGRPSSLNIGDTIGNFTILEVIRANKSGAHIKAKVLCSICNNEKIMSSHNLKKRNSCGCSQHNSSTWKSIGPKNMPWKLTHGESARNDLYCSYRSAARRRNLCFDIDVEFFAETVILPCTYCGDCCESVKNSQSKSTGNFYYTGIDRIDSRFGYTEENCTPCCRYCNTMKWDRTTEEFTTHVLKIAKRLNETKTIESYETPRQRIAPDNKCHNLG